MPTTNQYYEVKGKLSNSEKTKTIHVNIGFDGVYSKNDAMDYAAMFHSIDEIIHIKQGTLVKGIFEENYHMYLI